MGKLVRKIGMMGDLLILFLPVLDLVDAAARILVQRNSVFFDQFRIGGLDPVGGVFGVVLAGLGHIIAEAVHHFQSDQVAVSVFFGKMSAEFLHGLYAELAHFGIDVPAVPCQFEKPRHVIDSGNLRAVTEVRGVNSFAVMLFIVVHPEGVQQRFHADLDRMAEADGLDGSSAEHRAGEHRHRIGVVQEPGVRADFLHVVRKVQHDGNRPEGAEDAADAEGVGDGLAQPVFFRDLEVDHGRGLIAAHLNGIDHEMGSLESFLPVGRAQVSGDLRASLIDVFIQVLQNGQGFLQAVRIDVVQRDFGILKRFPAHAISKHVLGENSAARSHESDFRH
ncbi:MAG: hypothetical protein BWY31_00671 [Lentisphaerae bacterium ADurb.Bin242]|nr:MAG: hypothetical protein BWY31_00671 [Lentisphaerae bacterium ADurb.Bin242]